MQAGWARGADGRANDTFHSGKLHQRQIPTAATNWNGINYGGYVKGPRPNFMSATANMFEWDRV
jgi:hypothetical protein